jgi:hypothetical protein
MDVFGSTLQAKELNEAARAAMRNRRLRADDVQRRLQRLRAALGERRTEAPDSH